MEKNQAKRIQAGGGNGQNVERGWKQTYEGGKER